LPEKTQLLPVGHSCTVIGWGKRRHSDESGTNVLHEAEVPIISNESCKNVYYDYVITKNMFCAGANRIDTCGKICLNIMKKKVSILYF
jgi:serine protease 56